MNCRDTERLWNERLDARDSTRPDLDSALAAHAAACPACAAIASRYRALLRALDEMTPPATFPEFVGRVLRAVEEDRAPADRGVVPLRSRMPIPHGARLAAAAILIVASTIALWAVPMGKKDDRLAEVPTPSPDRSLADALAEATSATLDLARDASAPAGRVGRAVLASAAIPSASAPMPEVAVGPTSEVIQSVGGRVGAGVLPLSGSAQHAFGFLLPTASATAPGVPAAPPRSGT